MLQRTIVSLETKQIALLKRIAEKRNTSMTALVREAVSKYTEEIQDNPAQRLLSWGEENKELLKECFRDADPDLSQNIDHYLYGAQKKVSSR